VLKTGVLSYLVKKYDMDVELTSETMHILFQVVDDHWRCRLEHWKTKILSIVRIIKKDSKKQRSRGSACGLGPGGGWTDGPVKKCNAGKR
jgi:hypothetical protein